MAITIISSPNDFQNAYNELAFNVSSSNSTQPNFQFLVDVNVVGQTNPVARLTYPKQPSSGVIDLDVANVIKDYVTYDILSFNNSTLQNNINSVAKYYIEFGEIYDNVSGIPTIYANLTQFGTSGTPKSSTNAVFDFLDWSKTAFTSYALAVGNAKALNQALYTPSIRVNQQSWISFYDPNQNIAIVDIAVYNSSNGVLSTNSFSTFTTFPSIVSYNVGHSFLTLMGLTSYLTNPDAAYYVLSFKDNGDDLLYAHRVNIDQTCTNYEVVRLHWLNNLGGFDSFNFTKVSKTTDNITRNQYKKLQPLNYAKTDRLKTTYFTKTTEQIEINSDLLTDAQWQGLLQLVLSPIVIMETSTSTYVPVNILESNYTPNKVINEKTPTSLKLTIEYTFDNYRQAQ